MLSTQVVKFRLHVSDEDHKDRRPPHESLSPLCTSHQVEPADCGVGGSCHVPEDVESSQHNSCVSHSKHLLGLGGRGPWVHSNELCCSTGMRSQATSQGSSNSSWRNPRVLALNALIAQAEDFKAHTAASSGSAQICGSECLNHTSASRTTRRLGSTGAASGSMNSMSQILNTLSRLDEAPRAPKALAASAMHDSLTRRPPPGSAAAFMPPLIGVPVHHNAPNLGTPLERLRACSAMASAPLIPEGHPCIAFRPRGVSAAVPENATERAGRSKLWGSRPGSPCALLELESPDLQTDQRSEVSPLAKPRVKGAACGKISGPAYAMPVRLTHAHPRPPEWDHPDPAVRVHVRSKWLAGELAHVQRPAQFGMGQLWDPEEEHLWGHMVGPSRHDAAQLLRHGFPAPWNLRGAARVAAGVHEDPHPRQSCLKASWACCRRGAAQALQGAKARLSGMLAAWPQPRQPAGM